MSLIGALSTSTLAMKAQSHGMQTVSSNIANVNTTAYKRERTLFETLLNGTNSGNMKSMAVHQTDDRAVTAQGLLSSTGREDDLAINGQGFFVVSSVFGSTAEANVAFTRDGAFAQRYVDTGAGTNESYYTTGSGLYIMGWAANDDGTFSTSNSLSGLVPLRSFALDELSGVATTEASIAANIPSDIAIGDSVTHSGTVYDNEYTAQGLTYLWTKTAANNWTVDFSVNGGTVTAPASGATVAQFSGSAKLITPTDDVPVEITWDDGSTSTVNIDLAGMTQFGDSETVYTTSQDGSPNGRLYNEFFDEDGVLWGSYTNGRNRPLYKAAIADFDAPNNLELSSGNLFRQTEAAGTLSIRDLGNEMQDTRIETGNLERSNVDLGTEFSRMITVQKAYSMASKTFTTVDKMVEVAATLKR